LRPNVLVEATGDAAYPEDAWVGAALRIGGLEMRVDKRDQRCVVITIDPDTTERNPAILRAIAVDREACFGVYGSTVGPSRVAIGDPVVRIGPWRCCIGHVPARSRGDRTVHPIARRSAAARLLEGVADHLEVRRRVVDLEESLAGCG
jgi:hypothetical protein